jgi:S1-C subfamily serine protease
MEVSLSLFSNQMADAVATAAPSVVQVQGHRRPVSGVVYSQAVVVTTTRALGRDDHLKVRTSDGRTFEAELVGWDPTTHLVVLRVPGLDTAPTILANAEARVGHLALAVARSWSNALTASAGVVSVIGGPLPTGRHRSIEQVIRTTAPMHDGFAGGAFVDTAGHLLGLTTAAAIRGLGVVIPAGIAWKSAARVLEHGGLKRGYLGLVGQTVRLSDHQRRTGEREQALLVSGVTAGGPAEAAGLMVGDLLFEFGVRPVESPEDLLALLLEDHVNRDVTMRVLRGVTVVTLTIHVSERPLA